MARELTPDDLRDLLGAYALDAVDDDERESVEAWLARDPDARRDADELRETASTLAQLVAEPSGDLWSRIEERLGDGPEVDELSVPVLRLPPSRDRARPRRLWLVGAAAMVAVGIGVLMGIFVSSAKVTYVDDWPGPRAMERAALAATMQAGSRTADLVGSDGTTMAQVVVTTEGDGYVVARAMPALPRGRTYQLWAMAGEDPDRPAVSVGVLGRDPSVMAFRADAGVQGFALTEERAPGVERTRQVDKIEGWLA